MAYTNPQQGFSLRNQLKVGNVLTILLAVNILVFIAVLLIKIAFRIQVGNNEAIYAEKFGNFLVWIAEPLSFQAFLQKPWTVLTYMFVHEGFFHILFNLFGLWIFGRMFAEFISQQKLLSLYLFGGIIAGLFAMGISSIAHSDIFTGGILIGASGAIWAIIMAVTVLYPNLSISLLFLGNIKLKYLTAIYFVLNLISLAGNSNVGGTMAHFGGMLAGAAFALSLRKGIDATAWFEKLVFKNRQTKVYRPKKVRMHVMHQKPLSDDEYYHEKKDKEATLDEILDKINDKGMRSLSKKEKELLKKYSGKK